MTNIQRFFNDDSKGSTTKQQRRLPQLLEQIRNHAINELNTLFTEMLDGADDALFDQADKARSNKDQALYFDSMRELRVKRQGMEKVFGHELLNNFQKIQVSNEPVDDSNLDELPLDNFSLVQEDELEENLAIDSMVAKAVNKNEQALKQIITRFDTLLANIRVEHSNNPISPRKICESFREASHALELDIKAKLIVYKLFDRLVVSQFSHVYAGINENLVKNGVLPDLPGADAEMRQKQAARRKAANKSRQQAAAVENDSEDVFLDEEGNYVSNSTGSAGDSNIGTEVLGALRDLLAVQRGGGQFVAGTNVPAGGVTHQTASGEMVSMAPTVDNRQLVQALSTVQADIQQQSNAGSFIPVTDLRGQIGTVLPVSGPVSSSSIGQANDDVIDIISMLFDFILDDKNLPDEFKALIGRLQIPMLKVALLDDTFFSKGNHPARKLLNEMARAGIGWDREAEGNGVGLRDKVEEIVTRILNEFEDDTTLFAVALDEFHSFNAEQLKRSELIERRIREAEEGKVKSETAKAIAEEALKKIVGNKQLPDAIGRLLYEAWQSVMLLIYLREGDASESWKKHLLTAEELIESLVPPKTIEARKRLTGILPGLVKSIKAGLDAVAYGEFESAQLFQELEQIHLQVLKGEAVLVEVDSGEVAAEDMAMPVDRLKDELANINTDEDDEVDTATEDFSDDLDFDGFEDEHELHAADKKKIKEMDLAQLTGNSTVDLDALGGIEEIDMSVNPPSNSEISTGSLPEDDQFQALVETLQVGGWFELKDQGKSTRCKLAAIIPSVGKYIFVNRTGIKIADYTKSGLAIALRRQEISQLNDGALFDRALESIVSNLRSLKKTQDEGI